MREEIEKVLEAMREDYKRWSGRCASHDEAAHSRIREEMEELLETVVDVFDSLSIWINGNKVRTVWAKGF